MARAGRRDAGLLYLSQALGENPSAGANELVRGLKDRGLSYKRQDVLRDIAGIRGTPQTVRPEAVRGGYLSGVMRRKEVKALPPDEREKVKRGASKAVDFGVNSGTAPKRKLVWRYDPLTKTFQLVEELDYEDIEDIPDGGDIPDSESLASDLTKDGISALQHAIDAIYDRLGL